MDTRRPASRDTARVGRSTAGTPQPVIDKLNQETTKILRSAALKEQFGALGLEAIPTSPEAFAKLLRADIGKWGKVIKAAGAKPG